MELTLYNLRAPQGARKHKKRIGRGTGSGHGTTSTRGTKGQKSRSGTGGLKRLGLRKILMATPKFKGQKPVREKKFPVNLDILEKNFSEAAVITPKALLEKNIIQKIGEKVKILGRGKLSKKFTVYAHAFSKNAREAILKAGGKVIVK